MDRTPITELSWFKGHLAIADTMYVEGIGVCSHQPFHRPPGEYEDHYMVDVRGKVHVVKTEQLFVATPEESSDYWHNFKKRTRK